MKFVKYNGIHKWLKLTRCTPTDFIRVEKVEIEKDSNKFCYYLVDYSYGAKGSTTGIEVTITEEEYSRIAGILVEDKGDVLEKF
tara:strand:- start:1557 stop:1808 length:252 start_codon:yes stop_codon:yes gene_type:complete